MSEAHRRQPHHEQAGRTADPFLPKSPWPKAEPGGRVHLIKLHAHLHYTPIITVGARYGEV